MRCPDVTTSLRDVPAQLCLIALSSLAGVAVIFGFKALDSTNTTKENSGAWVRSETLSLEMH